MRAHPAPPPAPSDVVRRALRNSILDGAFFAIMFGAGESFFGAFALFLGAGPAGLALITAFPILAGSVCQFFAARITRLLGGRKRAVWILCALQAATFAPLFLTALLPVDGVLAAAACVSLYYAFGMSAGPPWNFWMGDLVPPSLRGSFFGRRSRILQITLAAGLLGAGTVLALTSPRTAAGSPEGSLVGFGLIFGVALAARAVSAFFLIRQHDPNPRALPRSTGLSIFLLTTRGRGFHRLALYLSLMTLATQIAGPFLAPFVLRDLRLSFADYTVILAVPIGAKWAFLGAWGRLIDRFGARKCLVLAGILVPLVPILWAVLRTTTWLVAAQVVSGLAFAGHELASFTLLLNTAARRFRTEAIAYFTLLNGIATATGGFLGAALIGHPPAGLPPYLWIFAVSAVLRLLVVAAFAPRLREVIPVEPIGYRRLFLRLWVMRPTQGPIFRPMTFDETPRGPARDQSAGSITEDMEPRDRGSRGSAP